MRNVLKVVHLLGVVGFLGSIAVYIVASPIEERANSEAFAAIRMVVLSGTKYITMPALMVSVLAGLGMMWAHRARLQRWMVAKLCIGVLLCMNAFIFVYPAVELSTQLATQSMVDPSAREQAFKAKQAETIYGAINVVLALSSLGIAVVRPRMRQVS